MNQKIIVAGIIIAIAAGVSYYFVNQQNPNGMEESPKSQDSKLVRLDIPSLFTMYGYENDYEIIDGQKIWRSVEFELNPEFADFYEEVGLKNKPKTTAIVYPYFTAAAYSEPGFYTYYRGECDSKCLTVELKEVYDLTFQTSGDAVQIFNLLGYPIITDMDIDLDSTILLKYDKIILLHNEYVTKKEFDAITSHPKVVYLYPNALYAEVEVNYADNTITLIRGHGYPTPEISNGFDWEYDNSQFEYRLDCDEITFHRIDNGWMSDCYPENLLYKSRTLLKQISDF